MNSDYVRVLKLFPFCSQNLFLFGLKWSPGTSFHNSKSKEPRCVPEKSRIFPRFFLGSLIPSLIKLSVKVWFNNQRVEKSVDLMLTIFFLTKSSMFWKNIQLAILALVETTKDALFETLPFGEFIFHNCSSRDNMQCNISRSSRSMLYPWATEDSWKLTALVKTRFMNKNVLQTARAGMSICAYAKWYKLNGEF